MTKGIILDNIKIAEALNNQEAIKRGCNGVTSYWFPMRELTTKTTLTKAQYAELYNIPATIMNEEEEEVANPEYEALENTIEVSKFALITDDNITESDGEEETILYESVDIDEYLPQINEEE